MLNKMVDSYVRLYKKEGIPELEKDYAKADRFMLLLIGLHWLLATTLSAVFYDTYLLGLVGGGLLFALSLLAYRLNGRTPFFRIFAAVALMSFPIIFIQQHFGRIEMHFHVFVILSFLTIYKDVRPLTAATLFTIIHHLLFNQLQSIDYQLFGTPIIVFNYGCGIDIVLLHAFFVFFEWIVLMRVIFSNKRSFLELIAYKNRAENLNVHLEEIVEERTSELEVAKERAESANRMKSEFLANMSHEIRTPMNAVLGFTELLDENIKEPMNRSYMNSIKGGTKTLMTIINDILDLSKIEAGKLHIEYHPVNIHSLMREIEDIFTQKMSKKELDFSMDIDDDVPHALMLDEVRIRQIIFNLINNAVKFTHSGGIRIAVHAQAQAQDHSKYTLSIAVEDTGIGIAESQMERVFESFAQQDGQRTREYGGTGLGLTISKRLAKLMHGDIELQSREGEGSTFSLVLHDVSVSAGTPDDMASTTTYDYAFEPATILVVDDIEPNRQLVREYLKKFPFTIIMATDGEDAVAKMNSEIDLVLMDIKMPRLDGYGATRKIRQNPALEHIPIITLTASVAEADDAIKEANFDGFLQKPVARIHLVEELARFLKHTVSENVQSQTIRNNGVALSEFASENREALKKAIDDEIIPLYDKSHDSGDMEEVKAFCQALKVLSEQFSWDEIGTFARELCDAAENFDIERIEKLYRHFNRLVKSLQE